MVVLLETCDDRAARPAFSPRGDIDVNKALLNSLTETEWLLVRETEKTALAGLDEDQLLALHTRVQRARTKYAKLYRRGAAASVDQRGGRGLSYEKNQRARDKAEVFETALSRVSVRLGVVARQASAELRDERISAARAARGSGGGPGRRTPSSATSTRSYRPSTRRSGGVAADRERRLER